MSDLEIIARIVDRVLRELPRGRAAASRETALRMMEYVLQSGDGNHLEIGILFGATLIMAALVKGAFGLKGECIGVDPLNGYYPAGGGLHPDGVYDRAMGVVAQPLDPHAHIPINLENVMENVYHFQVENRIRIIQKFSWPWPEELKQAQFSSAYIDGDHFDEAPTMDWLNVCPRVRMGGRVWFDDHNKHFPAVLTAVGIARNTPGWDEIKSNNQTAVFQRKD